MPDNFKAMAEEGVAKAREAYTQMSSAAQDGAKSFEEIVTVAQTGARQIGEKVLANVAANTSAAFDIAGAMAKCTTLADVGRLQAEFMQRQVAIAGEQTKELYQLSTEVAQRMFATVGGAAQATVKAAAEKSKKAR